MSNRKITDMAALTTPATGDVLPIIDISEAAAADKNKKISIGELFKGIPDGTAAAPSIAFESDDGNGMFLAGTDTVGITTGGTQRVTVDGSGNVTISGDLTVEGATTTVESTTVTIDDKNLELGSVASPSNTTADGGGITLKGASDKTITWVDSTGCWTFNQPTNFNDHVRIDSSGNVGVGTTSVSNALHVYKNATQGGIGAVTTANATLRLQDSSTSLYLDGNSIYTDGAGRLDIGTIQSNGLAFGTNNTERMRIDSSGNVAIGTSSADANLHIKGSYPTVHIERDHATNYSRLLLDNTSNDGGAIDGIGDGAGGLRISTSAAGTITERMRIDSSGNVGIGMVSPSWNKLSVAGPALLQKDNAYLQFRNTAGTSTGNIQGHSSYLDIQSDSGSSNTVRISNMVGGSATERLRIDSSGRLLVNTSTSRGTHGGGEAQFQIEGTNTATAGVSVTRKDNGTGGATFSFGKTRNGSVVQNGDNLGTIYWQADDGTDLATAACSIGAAVDGTPGANDMPGRIMFSTTADGASSPTERLRIDSSGQVILNNSASSGDATILRITGGTSGSSIIEMGDTADTDIGQIAYYQGSNAMAFRVNASERMRIDSSGNVGIGTTSASGLLAVHQAASSTSNYINITNNQTGASSWSNGMLVGVNASGDALCWQNESSNLLFGTNNSERLRIDSSGNVTVNTANNALINLGNTSQQHAEIKYTHSGQEFLDIKSIGSTSSYGNIRFFTGTDVERMRIDNSGNVFIGGTTASNADIALNANGSATFAGTIQSGGNSQSGAANGSALAGEGGLHASSSTTSQAVVRTYTTGNSTPTASIKADGSATFAGDVQVGGASYGNAQGVVTGADGYIRATYSGTNDVFRGYQLGNTTATSTISANGSATFAGAVSKGSGSFRISHPLPAKTETHHLVHSFIEGPQADLIYRGYADLVDGEATVNIDTAARMTEGTFEVLCTNISCFTSNESDWTAVKGSVTGNVLTITAQNATATSKVSWMVVGERKDQHMLDTDWTDNAGRVITEPLKVVDE